jgi:hypothetical protein
VGRLAAASLLAAFFLTTPAAAQSPSRPGPWALDVRGVTSPVPEQTVFYPTLASTALIPSRGFGLDLGIHAYLFNIGAARFGVGADLFYVRSKTKPPDPVPSTGTGGGSATDPGTTLTPAGQNVELDMRLLTPQVSLNFGSREGWSYISAGLGQARVITRTSGALSGRRESSSLDTINVGGGARWFFKSHLAFGFDIRLHNIGSGTAGQLPVIPSGDTDTPDAPAPLPPPVLVTPAMRVVTAAVGFSIR